MRVAHSTSMILFAQLALGSALAEPTGDSRTNSPRSQRPAGAEERLRKATSSICRGCDGEPQAREPTRTRERQAIASARRSRPRVTGA